MPDVININVAVNALKLSITDIEQAVNYLVENGFTKEQASACLNTMSWIISFTRN
jgi:hypothetical protein